MTGGQGSMRMPASSSSDQSQEKSNMAESSWEADITLIRDLLWPYRDYFSTASDPRRFMQVVKEIAAEYGARKVK